MASALVGCVTPALHKVTCSGSVTPFSNVFGVIPALSPWPRVAQGVRRGCCNRQGKEPEMRLLLFKLTAME